MKAQELLFSGAARSETARDDWGTPDWLFERCEREWGPYQLDAAASVGNAKCARWLDDAMVQTWDGYNVWCNPPYSMLKKFAQRAADSQKELLQHVTFLIPARTDTVAFHTLAQHASEIVFLKGRVVFVGGKHGAPFPSALVRVGPHTAQTVRFEDWRESK